jgi:hypothetical protein
MREKDRGAAEKICYESHRGRERAALLQQRTERKREAQVAEKTHEGRGREGGSGREGVRKGEGDSRKMQDQRGAQVAEKLMSGEGDRKGEKWKHASMEGAAERRHDINHQNPDLNFEIYLLISVMEMIEGRYEKHTSDGLGGLSPLRHEIGEGFRYLIVDELIRHGRSRWSRTSSMTLSPPWAMSG